MDFQGVAILVAAAGSFVTTLTAAYIAVKQSAMAAKLSDTHTLVNGMSHELQDADKKVAFAEGQKAGVAAERQQPMIPSGRG